MACDCITIDYKLNLYRVTFKEVAYPSAPPVTLDLVPRGDYNGRTWYRGYTTNRPEFTNQIVPFCIFFDSANTRYEVRQSINPLTAGTALAYFYITIWDGTPTSTAPVAPVNPLGSGGWESSHFSQLDTAFIGNLLVETIEVDKELTLYNGKNWYKWTAQANPNLIIDSVGPVYTELEQTYYVYFDTGGTGQWEIGNVLGGNNVPPLGSVMAFVKQASDCPPFVYNPVWIVNENFTTFGLKPCQPDVYKCLAIKYSLPDSYEAQLAEVNVYDVLGGVPSYVFTLPEYPDLTFKILNADYGAPFFAGWYLITLGPSGDIISYLENDGTILEYPFMDNPSAYGWSINSYFNIFDTNSGNCPVSRLDCGCGLTFNFFIPERGNVDILVTDVAGEYGGRNYYEFTAEFTIGLPVNLFCFWNGWAWDISETLGGIPIARLYLNSNCPVGDAITGEPDSFLGLWFIIGDGVTLYSTGISCTTCGLEDRIYKKYEAVKLPDNFTETPRGPKGCCDCEQLVLGASGGNSWENDITSSWIKVSQGGSATFKLTKNGQITNYVLEQNVLVNDINTIYVTIDWGEVLASDGVGCYKLEVTYDIGGIVDTITKGIFKLMVFSTANALHTARVKAVFNLYHESEGIDFTGSNVVSTHRFYGYIGNRQPNTEIDNIIYSNREMKSVIRENLNTYEIITDPLEECILSPLIDTYLLSENELYISDYNFHNHSYRYNDLPVILEESPEVEYYDFSRKAKVTASVSDKYKNKRTYFK
jgi:hypothetical protein